MCVCVCGQSREREKEGKEEGEREKGREGEREGLLTGPTAALPLEGASPCSYTERHHQKPVPNEVLPN